MNSFVRRTIAASVIVIALIVYFLYSEPNGNRVAEENPLDDGLEESNKSSRPKRKGPRKPPAQSISNNLSPKNASSGTRSKAGAEDEVQDNESDLDEKVRRYLDYLDLHDDPGVQELTTLGELAFDANDPASAYDHYLEVIEMHTDDPLAPFALYKFAWTQFNLGDRAAAVDDMALLIEWTEESESQLDQQLLETARQDLLRFQAE